jgi:hypothetical protein
MLLPAAPILHDPEKAQSTKMVLATIRSTLLDTPCGLKLTVLVVPIKAMVASLIYLLQWSVFIPR